MASGAADRLDVTAGIPSARSPSTRSSWEAAGVEARSGTSAQDRFGAALNAAQAQDDAAATRARAASQRDAAATTQARQALQRDQADVSRAASARARDSSVQADARASDLRADAAKPATGAPVRPQSIAQVGAPSAQAGAPADKKDTTAIPQPGPTERTAAPPSEATAPAREAAAAPAAADTQATAQTDSEMSSQQADANQPQTPDPVPTPVIADPAAALLALLATLGEGGPVRTAVAATDATETGSEDAPADGSVSPPKAGGAGPSLPALSGLPTGGAASGLPANQAAAPGTAATTPVAAVQGKAGKGAAPVEAAPAASGDAAETAATKGTDFLAALAEASQDGGQSLAAGPAATPQGAPPVQGSPPPTGPTAASAGPSATGQAAATPQTAAPVQTEAAIPIGQVPMAIGLRSLGGSNEFQIRLDPAELGRIDVKLAIDKAHGTVMTHLVVDRPETLAMLQRDAGQLQQALSQAGLDPSGGGLNLSLRGDGSAQGGGGSQQDNAPRGGAVSWNRDQAEAPQEIIAPTRWLRGYGGVDIRI
ncbi:flagellar hook-length control protein FliK [Methylobacterium mesophilicum SR1.6/6]|uniref:Flagellar hook-length control protein FliK n=1 Tax=Methylobacterium mesophilicum SR1.6/6 TaxID=908290 RepID=A0A6B9FC33_9HYPH|nr:flagellar hook-length control protein FliK [Methylobacterium mesophilicum]QGY01061.1 flagellar hook-length control protein FliK [Methylobacterium mesophilicum SR1.6/6]